MPEIITFVKSVTREEKDLRFILIVNFKFVNLIFENIFYVSVQQTLESGTGINSKSFFYKVLSISSGNFSVKLEILRFQFM